MNLYLQRNLSSVSHKMICHLLGVMLWTNRSFSCITKQTRHKYSSDNGWCADTSKLSCLIPVEDFFHYMNIMLTSKVYNTTNHLHAHSLLFQAGLDRGSEQLPWYYCPQYPWWNFCASPIVELPSHCIIPPSSDNFEHALICSHCIPSLSSFPLRTHNIQYNLVWYSTIFRQIRKQTKCRRNVDFLTHKNHHKFSR